MKVLLLFVLLLFALPEPKRPVEDRFGSLVADMKEESLKIKKLRREIESSDIMQGATEEFIARIDKLASESEIKRKENERKRKR